MKNDWVRKLLPVRNGDKKCLNIKLPKMENLFTLTRSIFVVEEEFSWQIEENGGHVENAETDTIKRLLNSKDRSRERFDCHAILQATQ